MDRPVADRLGLVPGRREHAGEAAAVLQFPPWFPISRANKDYILACAQRAAPRRVCVEFRDYAHVNARQLADRLSI